MTHRSKPFLPRAAAAFAALTSLWAPSAFASSHMDAPLITLDDAANTTDVYAFVTQPGGGTNPKFLTTAVAVYPFEEPGIGPNNFNFDDRVAYELHVALGADRLAGRPTISYRITFTTTIKNRQTIQQSFTDVIQNVNDAGQNLVQRYNVLQVDYRNSRSFPTLRNLGGGIVPPNNQGRVTPFYNQADNGDNPAKPGVASAAALDRYTAQTLFNIGRNHRVFAGQRDDGFFADIQAIFDRTNFRPVGQSFDSQGGFNVHTIVLNIPVAELGGDNQIAGVYATTSRAPIRIIAIDGDEEQEEQGIRWAQVGRQGNPLFCEGLVAFEDKDRYNRTSPEVDSVVFRKYAESPELARLINDRGLQPGDRVLDTGRTDLSAIFIPDLIKTDLSTPPARLAGPPNDAGFSSISVFGGDVLPSRLQRLGPPVNMPVVPGGWPNGRRFGDDVVDIALVAILSDLRPTLLPPFTGTPEIDTDGVNLDKVMANDIAYNRVFPYAATPLNGRNHRHH